MNAQECLSPKKIWVLVAIGVIISVAAIACTHEVRYIVSGSMDGDDQPYDIKTIPIYSLVMIKDVDGKDMLDEFEVGDVIAFHYSGVVVVHRVIAIDPVAGTLPHTVMLGRRVMSRKSLLTWWWARSRVWRLCWVRWSISSNRVLSF